MLAKQNYGMVKRVTIYDIYRNIKERQDKKTAAFEVLLDRIHKKIQIAADNNFYKFVYDVPLFVLGYPLYDMNKCIAYLTVELRNAGFIVKIELPKKLYISMDPIEVREYRHEKNNPVRVIDTNKERKQEYNPISVMAQKPISNPLESLQTKIQHPQYHPIKYSQPHITPPIRFDKPLTYNPNDMPIPVPKMDPFTPFDPIASVYGNKVQKTEISHKKFTSTKQDNHPFSGIVTKPDGKLVLNFD